MSANEAVAAAESHLTVLPEQTVARPSELMPTPETWSQMMTMAKALYESGLMPDGVKNPQAVATTMLKGRELGIPPMAAIEGIHVIKGKATVGAHLMLGLIKRAYGGRAIRVAKTDDTACTMEYREPGWDVVSSFTFTIEEAKRANLIVQGGNWTKYPAAMLRARAISAVGKMAFPEVSGGLYVAGELGDPVVVTETGDVVPDLYADTAREVRATVVEPPQARQEPRKASQPQRAPQQRAGPGSEPQEAEYREVTGKGAAAPVRTDNQNKAMHALAAKHFGDAGHDVLHAIASANYGVSSTTLLTEPDAAALITDMQRDDFVPGAWLDFIDGLPDPNRNETQEATQSAAPDADEAALIAFRELAESSDDWNRDDLVTAANGDPAKWLVLIQVAPTLRVLAMVTGEARKQEFWSQDIYDAYTQREKYLKSRADRKTA